jgi:polysaccharide deacetylase family protein (PEP-CTERM system associated)
MNSHPVSSKRHILTILVEDYFHVGAFENLIQQRNWSNFEPRYEQNTLKTLDLLDRNDTKATFFVLGWIAEQNPKLLREIVARGHEVASRGFYHRSLSSLTDDEFREDLRRTSRAIENACGQKVMGYRAAEKLSFEKDAWVLDILADEGFVYDASFIPSSRTDASRRTAHQIHTGGKVLWEFPYSTQSLGLGLLNISGGNYFRQIPYTLMRPIVRHWANSVEQPLVFYFHVWELDPEQPRISAASAVTRLRHYRKLDKMEWILNENLSVYNCVGTAEFLGIKQTQGRRRRDTAQNGSVSRSSKVTAAPTPVSIVIPCYNEVESLPYLANTIRSLRKELRGIGYEPVVIFVDDGSTDSTFWMLNKLFGGRDHFRILQHKKNLGVAAGIMTGIRAAETEIVCSMDCDCTYDPHELANMVPLLGPDVDIVTASPYHRDGGVRNVPSWRLFLSRGASILYRRVLRSKLDTYTSCFRVYRRSSVADIELTEQGFLGVAEMVGRLDLAYGKIVEFPAVLEVRLFGFSKMKTAKTVIGHLKLLSRLAAARLFGKSAAIKPDSRKEALKILSERSIDP